MPAGAEIHGWLLFIIAGWLTGFFAGLLGIGGGAGFVPAMVIGLPLLGVVDPELAKIAIATSLVLIVPTALAGAQTHAQQGAVDWGYWALLAPVIVAGGLLASALVPWLNASLLTVLFAAISVHGARQLLAQQHVEQPIETAVLDLPQLTALLTKSFGIGAVATALGIGVGGVTVPLLTRFIPLARAIGTSTALAIPMAIAGATGYLFAPSPKGCAACTGYVHLPAAGAIALAAVLGAPLGAQLTHILPINLLRKIFAVVLILVTAAMVSKCWPDLKRDAFAALMLSARAWSTTGQPAAAPFWLGPQSQALPSGGLFAGQLQTNIRHPLPIGA